MPRLRVLLALTVLMPGFALAQAEKPAPVLPSAREAPAPPEGLGRFRRDNPSCRSMTDDCSICAPSAAGELLCSTPAIACIATRWRCTEPG